MGSRVTVVPRVGIVELHRGQEQLLLGFADADFVGTVLSGKLCGTNRDAKKLDQLEQRPLVARRSRAAGAEPSRRTSISAGYFDEPLVLQDLPTFSPVTNSLPSVVTLEAGKSQNGAGSVLRKKPKTARAKP